MNHSIRNTWPAIEEYGRLTSQAILARLDGRAIAELETVRVIGPLVALSLRRRTVPLKNSLLTCATLAYCADCLQMLLVPVNCYLHRGGRYEDLDLSSLMPLVKPIAEYFALANRSYVKFAHLTGKQLRDFITTYNADADPFGMLLEETRFAGAKFCRYAAALQEDVSFLTEYTDGILAMLFEKATDLTRTQEATETFWDGYLDLKAELRRSCLEDIRKNSAPPPAASPPPPDSAAGKTAPSPPSDDALPAPDGPDPETTLKEAVAELEALVGLPRVKEEVKKLTAFLTVQRDRARHGLPIASQTLHFVFKGNPGTGKTTVGRIVSKILFGFGLLKTPKLVEADRAQLVGGYLGETAQKTSRVIDSALDGVLFIDEAYALLNPTGQDVYASEAVSTLLKRMEDHRERLSVVVAGYPRLMDEFLNMNPGLKSRFTRFWDFNDYSAAELCQIFLDLCERNRFFVNATCVAIISVLFTLAHRQRGENFGNARHVRNLFDEANLRNAQRLADLRSAERDKDRLMELDPSDLLVGPLAGIELTSLKLDDLRWVAFCPFCRASYTIGVKHLLRQLACKRCRNHFIFDCWELVPESVKWF